MNAAMIREEMSPAVQLVLSGSCTPASDLIEMKLSAKDNTLLREYFSHAGGLIGAADLERAFVRYNDI